MKVLALELSAAIGSLAFCDDSARLFRTFPANRKDSALFYENLEGVYRESGPPDVIVVGLGPGSYAGVRITIATAVGLKAAIRAKLQALQALPAIATQPLPQFEDVTIEHPSALRLVELATEADCLIEEELEPIYLREPYITTAKK